jgi:RNA polymerase sigma factor (sigma-70 family)
MKSNVSSLLQADSAKKQSEQRRIQLLAKRIAELPPTLQKVLALYYYEDLQIAEIATCFGLSEDRIRQILSETVDLLRTYLLSVDSIPQELLPPVSLVKSISAPLPF